jgi:hypothetical protein
LTIGIAQEDRIVFAGEEGVERLAAPCAAVKLSEGQRGNGDIPVQSVGGA